MNKTLTLILVSSIFMGRLSARPTLQNIRNAATPRNACRIVGIAAGFLIGAKIGYLIDEKTSCFTIPLSTTQYPTTYDPSFPKTNPLNPTQSLINRICEIFEPCIKNETRKHNREEYWLCDRSLRLCSSIGGALGAVAGEYVFKKLYDRIATQKTKTTNS